MANAIKAGESRIEIEGDLGRRVIRIKAAGAVAWAVAIGAVVISAAAIWVGGPPALGIATPAIGVLGVRATVALAGLVVFGGKDVVGKLRDQYSVSEANGRVVLQRKR